jgi:DNA polymerase III subunit delta'
VTSTTSTDVFSLVIGQERAVSALRAAAAVPVHAYLLVGAPGTGAPEAVRAFAAALLCPAGGCGGCEHCRAALDGTHPDLAYFRRRGASLRMEELKDAVSRSLRAPRSAARQVLVLEDVHLVGDVAPVLLKAVEEPPATTVFVLVAEDVPPQLVTLASRCVEIDLPSLDEATVARALVAAGVEPARAAAAAAAAGGRLDRARLLAGDEGFAARVARWQQVPERLNNSGAAVVAVVAELLEAVDEPVAVLRTEHERELARLEEMAAESRERGVRGRAEIVARQRREQRRVRTDELRAGLATLAAVYRDRILQTPGAPARISAALAAVGAIDATADALVRNPNEPLLLQALLLRLGGDG